MQLVQAQSLTLDTDAHDTCRYLFVPLWWKWEVGALCSFFSVCAPSLMDAATRKQQATMRGKAESCENAGSRPATQNFPALYSVLQHALDDLKMRQQRLCQPHSVLAG